MHHCVLNSAAEDNPQFYLGAPNSGHFDKSHARKGLNLIRSSLCHDLNTVMDIHDDGPALAIGSSPTSWPARTSASGRFRLVPLPLEELAKNRKGDLVLGAPSGFLRSNDIGERGQSKMYPEL